MRNPVRLPIVLAIAATLSIAAVVGMPWPASTSSELPRSARGGVVELIDFLPRPPVRDGSVDYTTRVQAAIDASAGRTLRLPPFPVLVAPPAGTNRCLLVSAPIEIVGSPGSRLLERTGAVQLLRCENVDGLRLEGFALEGVGGVGVALAHGTLQVWRCSDVELRGVEVRDSDADGIAIADSANVRVSCCVVERASKASIYLSNCIDAVVDGNVVRDVTGHITSGGNRVGTGILLLSNTNVVCSDNVVDTGLGNGILCGANSNQARPNGAILSGNRISSFTNPTNAGTASGIQLANVDPDHATNTVVEGNSIRACGPHGIDVSNHDGAVIRGNTLLECELSGISVGHARDVVVHDNVIINTNTRQLSGQAGIYLHSTTAGIDVRGNTCVRSASYASTPFVQSVFDGAPAGVNHVEP